MTRLKPVSPTVRCALAGLALLWLAVARLAAQPMIPPATNDVDTNPPAPPELVTTATTTNFTLPTKLERFDFLLATARFQASTRDYAEAEKTFVKLLAEDVPETMQQTALFEFGQLVGAENDLPRAQAIYTQYLQRWPGDEHTPEILLRQGQLIRQMGLPNLALAKFYAVMTAALSLKNNQLPYYKGLVLQAQVEIAETHYLEGQFKDAVDYYSRLMAQNDPSLDRAQIQFRLIRSLEAINHHEDAANQAQDFLTRFPDSLEAPEVRYHLAQAFKGQNRNTEALQQVKIFLKEERDKTTNNPEALQVYLALVQLDPAPAWQLPVRYQVGITYERLLQPQLAIEAYRNILTNAAPLTVTNLSPSLKAVVDMAGWRLNFLEWNHRAEVFNHPNVATAETNLNLSQP